MLPSVGSTPRRLGTPRPHGEHPSIVSTELYKSNAAPNFWKVNGKLVLFVELLALGAGRALARGSGGTACQGRAGQGRAGQSRTGQGRAGQVRSGQVQEVP